MAQRGAVTWHDEALNAAAKKAAARIAPLASGFYLAGGTGLALRLGHRISIDLDLFSRENALEEGDRSALLEGLRAAGGLEIEESKDGACHLRLEGTRVSLLRYPYPLLGPLDSWRGLAVASVADIAAMKVAAIIGRGVKKDFIDLHEIRARTDLETLLRAAARKYASHHDFILQAARALVYFGDAEKDPMPRMLKRISWERVKAGFEKDVPALVAKLLK